LRLLDCLSKYAPGVLENALNLMLVLHSFSYSMASRIAVRVEKRHPKLRIQRYHEWFCGRVNQDAMVIDIGCGKGYLTSKLAEVSKNVMGVDIVKDNILIAQSEYGGCGATFVHADATDMGSYNRTFDVVILSNVLEHIHNRVKFLVEISGLINEGGYILLRVPMYDRDWITAYKKERGLEWRLDPTHYTEYTMPSLQKELSCAGLHIQDVNIIYGECFGVVKKGPLFS
jgi:2-polyprenyl-3-methyl-5-hydroxy-6-metoxy-1,4-benzoquinol methylase